MRITSEALELENSIAPILARQQAYGVCFNREAAEKLYCSLLAEKVRLKQDLQRVFKPRVISLGQVIPKASNSKYGTRKGQVYTRIKLEEFNPSSRTQIVDRLKKEFDWQPMDFTDKGNPAMDEEVIDALPFEELKPLKDYMVIDQRLKQLSTGVKSYLKCVKEDGRIYGAIMQSGTVTGRCAHHSPNMNVPSIDKMYGKEFRSLFCVPPGKVMIGCDADGLEARTMSGFLVKFDNGDFKRALLEGKKEDGTDIHSINADVLAVSRDCAKTFLYALVYGARNPKLGLILMTYGINFREYVPNFDQELKGILRWGESKGIKFSVKTWECLVVGKYARKLYGERLPALPELIEDVGKTWKANGYLKGLDGRKLYPRSEHAVFNTLNQSAGAIIMKKALQIADNKLQLQLVPGRDYEFVLNIHDEIQLEVTDCKEIIQIIQEILPQSMKEAGEYFNFPCPISGSVKIGQTWGDTH